MHLASAVYVTQFHLLRLHAMFWSVCCGSNAKQKWKCIHDYELWFEGEDNMQVFMKSVPWVCFEAHVNTAFLFNLESFLLYLYCSHIFFLGRQSRKTKYASMLCHYLPPLTAFNGMPVICKPQKIINIV
uniref:Secreted protein n=1 Tax=Pyxicephalus adspersus TaxID=30357 RepID=A0AAV3AB58_PYXAD|nr:TPA: hypothetical protein GDO54_010832 [Pyxicephalus adspersus]